MNYCMRWRLRKQRNLIFPKHLTGRRLDNLSYLLFSIFLFAFAIAYFKLTSIDGTPFSTSKRVFGVKTKGLKIQLGDWGTAAPGLRKIKIQPEKDGIYEISAEVKWVNFEENTVTRIGTVTIQAEEKEGAYFGFVAKNLKITKAAK